MGWVQIPIEFGGSLPKWKSVIVKQSSKNLAKHLVEQLSKRDVDYVFGIPGVHTVELYRALAGSDIRHVTPRHEQGAGFMADGYARASGKPGVCFIISGPGMTNILTAMAQAYADSVPMLVISTVVSQGRMGSGAGWLHDMPDQRATVSGCAAFSRTIQKGEDLSVVIDEAFALFEGGRPRPVHIEIPVNLLTQPMPCDALRDPIRAHRPGPCRDALALAAGRLALAEKPLILAGGGARHALITNLAEQLDAPVVTTTNGRGILPVGHPLSVPVSASFPNTRDLITEADVVLALGTELGATDYDFSERGDLAIPGFFIRIDIDPLQMQRPISPDLAMVSDAAKAVSAMIDLDLTSRSSDGGARAARARSDIDGFSQAMRGDLALLAEVRDNLPEALIVGDSTQLTYAGNSGFEPAIAGGYFNSATGFGTLGYGLPAAIGASLATGLRCVCLSGDGGLQFVLGELAAAREIDAEVILILHDNNGYGEIKSYMLDRDIPPLGVEIYTPDLCGIARSCGWQILHPQRTGFIAALKEAARMDGPVMIYLDEATRSAPAS